MTRIYAESPYTKAIHDKIINKIKGNSKLRQNEFVVKKWQFGDAKPHSGQIYATKILHNGNIQTRITTVVSDVATILNDTKVTTSEGNVLKELLRVIWQFKESKPKLGQIYEKKILPNGNIQSRITISVKNDDTIITDTRVKSPKGKLLKAYFGIRGPKCTVVDSDGKLLQEFLPTKMYANKILDVHKIIASEISLNPDMKFLF